MNFKIYSIKNRFSFLSS